jgi:hypothetical protein
MVSLSLQLQSQSQAASNLALKAVEIGKSEVGVRETGKNRGYLIDKKNRKVGNRYGDPWCMANVYDWYDSAGKALKTKNPLMKTGRCASQLRYAKMIGSGMQVISNRMIGKIELKKGDIFILSSKGIDEKIIGKDWNGHTGLIEKQIAIKSQTLEGNTNQAGSREGDGIYEKVRINRSYIAIIRIMKVDYG